MTALCRDCSHEFAELASGLGCPECGSSRVARHPELGRLTIAHVDCDAFFAAVEKRDDPALENRPVIIGGGRRGVVATACYFARMNGVHSAMPMFKALRLCPDATVIRPNMAKYQAVSREVRTLMAEITPMVEPLSIDEAFLDLAGTGRLHGQSGARTLAGLANRVEREIGITLSIGLSYNKFLAKLASDLDKPRGFAVIGRAEAVEFLAPRAVGDIWGVGRALQRRLAADGIDRIGQFRRFDETELIARYGAIGRRLAAYSEGRDGRRVTPHAPAKSISA
jgi:DNA polymerase-4